MGASLYLSPDGQLVDAADGGRVISSDVASYGQVLAAFGSWSIPVTKIDGTGVWIFNGAEQVTKNVPSGCKPVSGSSFLTSDARLVRGDQGVNLITDVKAYGLVFWDGSDYYQPFQKTDDSFVYLLNSTETSASGVPSGSVPVVARFFLAPDGRLVDGGDGSVLATEVEACGMVSRENSSWLLTARQRNGCCILIRPGSVTVAAGVPVGSAPVGAGVFRALDGRLIDGTGAGAIIASGIGQVGAFAAMPDSWRIPLGVPTTTAKVVKENTTLATSGVPSDATPVGGSLFLAPNGDLLDGSNNGKVIASSVAAFGEFAAQRNAWSLPIRLQDGTCRWIYNGEDHSPSNIPAGSLPTAGGSFLTSDGRQLRADGYTEISNVKQFGGAYYDGSQYFMPFLQSDGTFAYIENSVQHTAVGVPSGSIPATYRLYLSNDGRLIDGADGTVIASDIATCGHIATRNGGWILPAKKLDATFATITTSGATVVSGVPSDSTPVAAGIFRAPDGRLIDSANGGSVISADAALVGTYFEMYDTTWSLAYTAPSPGC